jgi:diketogulonate reductase-like aldo/keto reductase
LGAQLMAGVFAFSSQTFSKLFTHPTLVFYRYSKANTPQSETIDLETNPAAIKASVDSTLDKLGFKPDLLLIHNPYIPAAGKILEFWRILEDQVNDGTLEGVSLGVSNFRPQDLQAILDGCKIRPVVNRECCCPDHPAHLCAEFASLSIGPIACSSNIELEYHPYVLEHLSPLLALQSKEQIVTQSYGTLSPILRHPTGGPLKPVLTKIAQRLSKESGKNVDEASVLLLWTMGHGVVALTSSTKPENLQKMVDTEGLPDLSKEDMEEIDSVGRSVHFRAYVSMVYLIWSLA